MTDVVAFSPLLPLPLLAALGLIFCGVLMASVFAGAWRGAVLRAGIAALLMAALLNPRVVAENRKQLDDIAVIIVDRSQSQRIEPRPHQTDEALATLKERLAEQKGLQVRILEVENDNDDGTHLVTALQRALADVPQDRLAGSVLITDGQVHDVGKFRGASGAPMHVLITGLRREIDRRLVIEQAPGYGVVGKDITLTYRVEDDGRTLTGTDTARVHLRLDGELIASTDAVIGQQSTFTVALDHAGNNLVEIEVDALNGELSLLNNRVVTTVNGVRDRLKVLLISGLPHAGERTWRNLLKSDPSVDLVHFTILRPPQVNDPTPINELALIMFPTQELFEEKLGEFDLIVFDRYVDRGVLPTVYHDNIKSYLLDGGAILFADGPEYSTVFSLFRSSLGTIMPFEPVDGALEQGFRPKVTITGRRHPVTANLTTSGDEKWGRWLRQVPVRARSGAILMTGVGDTPLLALDRIGEGRVAQISSDHIWLWARRFEGGGPHAELVRRLAHWLMKEPELEEERLSVRVENANLLIERRSLDPGPVDVTVSAPSGASWVVPLVSRATDSGVSTGQLEVHETGLFRIEDGTNVAFAASGSSNSREGQNLRSSAVLLSPLVKGSGGGLYRLEDGFPGVRFLPAGRKVAGNGWFGLVQNNASAVIGATEKPLLPNLVLLVLVLAGLGVAWWREGR